MQCRRNVPLTKLQRRVLKSILKAHAHSTVRRTKRRKIRMTAKRRKAIMANLRKARKARWK